jgi:hypothetical protein
MSGVWDAVNGSRNLNDVEAVGTRTSTVMAKPLKFDDLTSWTVVHYVFEALNDHVGDCTMRRPHVYSPFCKGKVSISCVVLQLEWCMKTSSRH